MIILLLFRNKVTFDSSTPWTVTGQASLSMGFPRQEYLEWVAFASPGDLPNPGIESEPPVAGGFFTAEVPGKLDYFISSMKKGQCHACSSLCLNTSLHVQHRAAIQELFVGSIKDCGLEKSD